MIKIVVLAGLAFVAASMLATWLYGHFAASVQGDPSHALPVAEDETTLDYRIGQATAAHPGQSGLVLLDENLDAFAARGISARLAERSLDLLYYIWNDDLTGRLLMAEMLEAAERGVRVRILVDDIGTGHSSEPMSAMAHHPQIEIRVFNPTRARPGRLRRGIEMALRTFSVTRRMHNKAWIADGRIAILGGRNIGDAYFDAAESTNFRDMDVLVMGPAVAQTETIFDEYWNSGLALPADRLTPLRDPDATLAKLSPRLAATAARPDAEAYLERIACRIAMFDPEVMQPDWTPTARVLADPPERRWARRARTG